MHAVATFREIKELLIIIVLNVVKRRFVLARLRGMRVCFVLFGQDQLNIFKIKYSPL